MAAPETSPPTRSTVETRTAPPARLVIEELAPVIDGGRLPLKRVVGEPVTVTAVIFAEGHDRLHCVVAHTAPGERQATLVPMVSTNAGLDRWEATFVPPLEGRHRFRVLGWVDHWGSWCDATTRKLEAGVAIDSEVLEGAAILEAAGDRLPRSARDARAALEAGAALLRAGDTTPMADRGSQDRPSLTDLVHSSLRAAEATASRSIDVLVERERALFSAWYELFPRSWSTEPGAHGTFVDVIAELDYVASMGFDILYLPPIHPIGTAFRKGPNNHEVAGPDDPGSPWAIGGPEGGHTAIHPALGDRDDFRALVRAAAAQGLEVAMDIALQCSPDHPWVTDHPEWFRHRPDGSIQYAENPPKKYQDIYPLDFEGAAWRTLWEACLDIVMHWHREGVKIFRIDNPHTKPFAFWEWLIGEMRAIDPHVIFLAEAFTRPAIMHRLGAIGFTQSYSYFPWRVGKDELTEYFTELSSPPSVDRFRPSCWPTTPDILPWHLMDAPRSLFAARAFLAATLSPSYGIYGPGYELGDNQPAGNGKEEYFDSEKYQIRTWDRASPDSLRGLLAELNRIRQDQLALHTLRTLRFHGVDNDQLLCFSKSAHAGPAVDSEDPHAATVVVVANLDPFHEQRGTVTLDLASIGLDPDRAYEVHDLLADQMFEWSGASNYVELHPDVAPGHIFRIAQH